jgi:hypothetical protein
MSHEHLGQSIFLTSLGLLHLTSCSMLGIDLNFQSKKMKEYTYEFPEDTCETYNASESNSSVKVCRSIYRENRFFLERLGFAKEPDTTEQTTRKFLDRTMLILGALGGVPGSGDGIDSAHYQNPDRWERAADEYARSRYGPNATIQHFGHWSINPSSAFNQDHWYTFEVVPGDLMPPWGSWKLNNSGSHEVVVEVLDTD